MIQRCRIGRKYFLRGIFLSIFYLLSFCPIWAVTFVEQAERLQLIYAHLIDFRPNEAPLPIKDFRWQVGGDLLWLPEVDNRVGRKTEKVNPPSLIPRPRGQYFHPSGGFVGISWIPPVTVQKYTMNLPALEAGYRHAFQPWLLGIRGHYSQGVAKGPMTDSQTEDEFRINRTGLDASFGYQYQTMIPYLGGGSGNLNTELKIKVDNVKMKVEHHSYVYYFVGMSYLYNPHVTLNFEQYRTETFLRHLALSLNYAF